MRRHSVQELLQRDGLVVAQVVDARDVLALDGRQRGGVEVGECEQVLPRRPPPHGQQAVAEEPARRLDHLDAPAVDGADAQDDGHHGRSVTGREQALLRQEPRARVHGAGGAVHAFRSGPLGRRFALDVREAHQHELAHAGRTGRREQVLHEADVRPRQERLRSGREEDSREVDDAVDVPARLGQRRGIPEVRPAHGGVGMHARVEGQRRAVHQQPEAVRAREQMAGEERAHVAGGAGDEDVHATYSTSSSRPLGS